MANPAFIFPGQGSQFVGMARDFYKNYDLAKERFEEANHILGFDLARLCFEGPEKELARTDYTQPAIFVHSCIVNELLLQAGYSPIMAAGHSLGEYSALVAAGVLEFADALELVALRGRLMFASGEKTPGTMAAVMGLGREKVEACCAEAAGGEVVQLANLNSPEQLVISGAVAAVERAMTACAEAGAKKVVPLTVSGAFHSALMAEAAGELGEKLRATRFGDAEATVIPNVTAQATRSGEELRELLIRQLTEPVLWADSMAALRALDESPALEVGPGKVLMGLMRRIDRGAKVTPVGDLTALRVWMESAGSEEAKA